MFDDECEWTMTTVKIKEPIEDIGK